MRILQSYVLLDPPFDDSEGMRAGQKLYLKSVVLANLEIAYSGENGTTSIEVRVDGTSVMARTLSWTNTGGGDDPDAIPLQEVPINSRVAVSDHSLVTFHIVKGHASHAATADYARFQFETEPA